LRGLRTTKDERPLQDESYSTKLEFGSLPKGHCSF